MPADEKGAESLVASVASLVAYCRKQENKTKRLYYYYESTLNWTYLLGV